MKEIKKFPKQEQALPGDEYKMNPEPEIIRENYKGSEKLTGKTALITGGDSGIGRSVAVHFAREGANIAIVYHKNDDDANQTQQMVVAEGAQCLILKGDLKKAAFCKAVVKKTTNEFGTLNILVNNAAMQFPDEQVETISTEQVKKTFETNIYPFFFVTQEALKIMKKGDCIVNTTSFTAYRGSEHLLDYSSTKGAIVTFTRSLSAMLVEKGIRVNGVAPGPIWTPLIVSSIKGVSDFGKDTPMGRAGQPSEVAPAYVF